jgi:hypothetical protein
MLFFLKLPAGCLGKQLYDGAYLECQPKEELRTYKEPPHEVLRRMSDAWSDPCTIICSQEWW